MGRGTAADINFCRNETDPGVLCKEGQGDCDSDDDCEGNLVCGFNNCGTDIDIEPNSDCCEKNRFTGNGTIGDYGYCSQFGPCGLGQGHCSSDQDCQEGLVCGEQNCQEFHPNAYEFTDCCEGAGRDRNQSVRDFSSRHLSHFPVRYHNSLSSPPTVQTICGSIGIVLVGGSATSSNGIKLEGNVFANNRNGRCGPVCDDNWVNTDASVVCRQLGLTAGLATHRSRFGNVVDYFAMDQVRCSGTENFLWQCAHDTIDDCSSGEGAGVICAAQELRELELQGGSSISEGNVFAKNKNGKFGPVCDDRWNDTDATVTCKQLGYGNGTATGNSYFGNVNAADFAMDEVGCNGSESILKDCNHLTTHDCGSREGAGVRCFNLLQTTASLELRGGTGGNEGNVFVRNSAGYFGPVCDDYWDDGNARVVCRQLGFNYSTATVRSYFGQTSGVFAMDNVRCSGNENSIQDCPYELQDNCGPSEAAGVKCYNGVGADNDWSICSSQQPCNEGEGDCDNDNECRGNLVCGNNGDDSENCRQIHGNVAAVDADCCILPFFHSSILPVATTPTTSSPGVGGVNDWSFCSPQQPCEEGRGDCDYNSDCRGSLECGENNCQQINGDIADSGSDCCVAAATNTLSTTTVSSPAGVGGDNDVSFCSSPQPCEEGQGDCDFNSDCRGNLICGNNNCRQIHGNISAATSDCCVKPVTTTAATTPINSPGLGTDTDWGFCTAQQPCDESQGDCDNDGECRGNLVCGRNNCRQIHGNISISSADCCIQNITTTQDITTDQDITTGQDITATQAPKTTTSISTHGEKEEALRYCSPNDPEDEKCKEGDGDCDSDDDCKGDLVCGLDNCKDNDKYQLDPEFKIRYPKADCCETVNPKKIGNFSCGSNGTESTNSAKKILCENEEGHCNTDDDCKEGLTCGYNNCKDFTSRALEDSNCCYLPSRGET